MMKFKQRIIRISRSQIKTIFLLLIGIGLIYFLMPSQTKDSIIKIKDPDKKMEEFVFDGVLENKNTFDDKYVSMLYIDNNKYKSHLINLKKMEEVNYSDFVNKNKLDEFNNTIKDLLLKKYPSFIVDMLVNNSNAEYSFEEDNLYIYYYLNESIETIKSFNIKIDYDYIANFLNFKVKTDEKYDYEDGYAIDTSKVSISITFDDGPNNEKTIAILNALEDYKMSSTFFMVGYKLENDIETVKKVSESHSEIGYHSYAHQYFTKQKTSDITREFQISDNTLFNITGKHFKLTRPPYGSYNKSVLNSIDTPFIRWNLDTNDWKYKDVDYIKNYVLNNLKDGAIILFHDSYQTSVEAATELFKILYLKDIQVLSISKLAELKNIDLEAHEVYYSF